ncbi:hypothetical protein ABFT23_19040 [Nocardioides sp. C4-1]|uniref:hypothetical protein n=1 Tax=Nocardioides sp. C4-1 TaxID=3151851 RepID=UPI003265A52B
MLTVRVLPRRGVALRAAVATVEVTAVLALGHLWAGGALPAPAWLVVMAAAVFGAGLLVLHGRVRPVLAVPALMATQVLLHAWLTALTMSTDGAPGHTMDAASMAGHETLAHGVLDARMLAVHLAGGLVTALLWELRARAAEVLVSWSRTPLPPLPSRRIAPAPVTTSHPSATPVVTVAPRRGPPAALVLA